LGSFWKEINIFIQQGCIKLIKSDSEVTCALVQKIYISNKCCSFKLSIHQRIKHKNIMHDQLFFKILIIRNVSILE